MKTKINVIKASGERAIFSVQKLRSSLMSSGASEEVIEEVIKEIQASLHDEMTTKRIYQLAFSILKRRHKPAASRYKLKKAIMELGPSGFPFEKYVSELFKSEGHTVELNLVMKGRCVNHEVDILAEMHGVRKVIECKYHNLQGTFCDVKVPLYVHSRFRDIIENISKSRNYQSWIVTNTRFSADAAQYALCSGLNLLGWDYPFGEGLRERIDQAGLYPITCMTELSQREKANLMDAGWVVCSDVTFAKKILKEVGIPLNRHASILKEASALSKVGYKLLD